MGSSRAHPGSEGQASKVRARMRFLPRALVACGTGFAVSLLAACGGGAGLLSGDQANSLSNQLDQVGAAVGSRNCAAENDDAQRMEQNNTQSRSHRGNEVDQRTRRGAIA